MKTKTCLLAATVLLEAANMMATVRYVDAASMSAMPPYTTWATAAATIQDAIDIAAGGDEIVVTNGVYQTGGRVVDGALTNRVTVTTPITVRSVNGPELTVIAGYRELGDSAVRCVYLADGATLVGFTLTNGATSIGPEPACSGGGVWCASASAVVSNCVIRGNSAYYAGGGTYQGTLNTCVLSGNSAREGGGTYYGTLNNCIVYYNSGGNFEDNSYNYCCTPDVFFPGYGNFRDEPLFADQPNGNLRLQANSPCINAGFNPSAPGGTDLDGNPRVIGGTVDVGAYEFQSPQSLISYAWLKQYGLSIDPSIDSADPDGDRLNNWQEWRAGTDPTNALSVLRLLTPTPQGPDLMVTWESVTGRNYFLEWSTNLGAPGFERLATQLSTSESTTSFTHTNAASRGPHFYRVGVER